MTPDRFPGGEAPATRPPTVSEQRTIEAAARLVDAVRAAGFDPATSCLAYMRVRTGGRTRDIALGAQTAIRGGVTVLDWQRAPLAAVFFAGEPGEDYEIELDDDRADGRTLTGTLIERALLVVARGELVEVATGAVSLFRSDAAEPAHAAWIARVAPTPSVLQPLAADRRAFDAPLARGALDPSQRRAVELPRGRHVLVLGDAGFGKTTVALHRLAWLCEHDHARPQDMLVLVPTEGLRRLTARMLDQMELAAIQVATTDQWIAAQARRLFPDLPARDSRDATANVISLKRHPALRAVLPAIASRRRGPAVRRDLLHLFGDRALLDRVVAAADGAISPRAIDEVIDHVKVQFSQTTEQAHSHVDADRLVTIDGRAIDDGTPMQDADTIDVEDCAVMFELNRLRTGRDQTPAGTLPAYRYIAIDEAQEIAPLELSVIGRAVAAEGALIVAGDAEQHTDESAWFAGWDATMAALGASEHERVTLQQSHRCPPAIAALARSIRAWPEQAPGQDGETAERQSSDPIWATRFASACHQTAAMIEAVRRLLDRDSRASVAVVCRSAEAARRTARRLSLGLPVWLALDGAFGFEEGVDVTCVAEVKGLEFEHVIVPDADGASYPATLEASRALYVAVTRAVRSLWLSTTSAWSPVLAGAAPWLTA